MRKIAFLSFIFIVTGLLILTGCHRTKKEFWPDGTPKSVIETYGGNYEGKAVWYFENGKIMLECSYKNNKLDGLFRRYYDNGFRKEEYTYVNDKRQGPFRTWDRLGRLKEAGNYSNNLMDGSYKKFYKLGTLQEEGAYLNGDLQGKWFYYDPYGHMIAYKIYEKGKLVQQEGVDPKTASKQEEEEE